MAVSDIVSKQVYSTYEHKLEKEVLEGPIPKHLGIIMDGNRRYAHEYLESNIDEGHRLGEKKIENVMDWCLELGIKYVTLYAFSSENFKREADEVSFLMDLAESSFYEMADNPKIHNNRVAIRALGGLSALPEYVRKAIDYAYEKTKDYSDFTISICLAYGGRQEIVNAVKEISQKVQNGLISPDQITEDLISSHLYTWDMPDPDLILRTSGEVRVSNFLLWQLAYSELYFTDVYWPGFRRIDLLRAIRSYQQRGRRFGN
ncbi:MAG: polyprenyl diphosphate synthase [archaeon]|nr:polyprenyl diphosphate synthase [archaeon]